MIIKYPVTDNSVQALGEYSWLSSRFQVELGLRDSRELVRLLENRHYPNIMNILHDLEKYGKYAGEISDRILDCNDTMVFPRLLAEFYLFTHFYNQFGPKVTAVDTPKSGRSHDINLDLKSILYKIEVYSPTDIFGFQVFDRLVMQIIKYHEIPRGFYLRINAHSDSITHTQEFPPFRDIYSWADIFVKDFGSWIASANTGDSKDFQSPIESYSFKITVLSINENTFDRTILRGGAPHSTDTKMYFEISDPEFFAKTNLGINLHEKLDKHQAGFPENRVVRLMFINLRLSSTTDLGWLKQTRYFNNLKNDLKFLCADISPFPPYEAIFTCEIGRRCGFAPPVTFEHPGFESSYDLAQEISVTDEIVDPYRPTPEQTKQEIAQLYDDSEPK